MEIEEEFDRITGLGFFVTIDWNIGISITYDNDEFTSILVCSYDNFNNIKFIEIVESSIDIFYEWYNKHKDHIDDLTDQDLYDITLGNITKRVKRDLNLGKIL